MYLRGIVPKHRISKNCRAELLKLMLLFHVFFFQKILLLYCFFITVTFLLYSRTYFLSL